MLGKVGRRWYIYVLLALVSASFYVGWSLWQGSVGFALDDAWIHQVYARNLALRGEFSFVPGVSSAGSTSPLWTFMLAPAFWLAIDPRIWTVFCGSLLIGFSAALASRLTGQLVKFWPVSEGDAAGVVVGLAVLFEWHLAWGAVSGMEIPLFVFLTLFILDRLYSGDKPWVLGVLVGLLALTRPEGLVFGGLIGLGLFSRRGQGRVSGNGSVSDNFRVWDLLAFIASVVLILVPYLSFNFVTSGTPLPNTFYAKNAEYGLIAERVPYLMRWVQLFFVPWVGVGVLLGPGLVYLAIGLMRRRMWYAVLPLFWLVLLPALYAWRLPVSYQHGRYEIPIIPIMLVYGVWGTFALFERIRIRFVKRVWGASAAAVLIAFWGLGANAYAADVSVIDCEMVQSARWVLENVPPSATIAVHDIGAFGFINNHSLIDLAGLVSPEVIPFIRDQDRLRDFLFSRRADYVVFFPDWYPLLAGDNRFIPVKNQICPATLRQGGTNMVIYQILYD